MKRFSILSFLVMTSLAVMAKQPQEGYRGFLEWSNDVRSYNTYYGKFTDYYTGVSTSHGYQIKEWIYTGIGGVFEYCKNGPEYIFAPFLDIRSDLKFGKFTPFVDARIGYNFTHQGDGLIITSENGGVYFSPKVGYRFNWGRKFGINLGLGMTLIGYKDRYSWNSTTDEFSGVKNGCDSYFSFSVGFDF